MTTDQTINLEWARLRIAAAEGPLAAWGERTVNYPGFRDWNRTRLAHDLDWLDGFDVARREPESFEFDTETQRQHRIVMSYYALEMSRLDIAEVAFYFRRFPFRGLPVSKASYLRTSCELYFSRVHTMRDRLEQCLKAMQRSGKAKWIKADELKQSFHDRFETQINARNAIHSHSYDDPHISALTLANLIEPSERGLGWQQAADRRYRESCRVWRARVEETAIQSQLYVGIAAHHLLKVATFLDVPKHSV